MAWTEQDYQEIVARLMAESIGVNEVPDAGSTDDISSLPAYQPANGTEVPTVVKASLELLVAPALEAADKANEAADKAESNATAAQTAANTANEKAELAAKAASDATAAKEEAETATQSANNAASNAEEKAEAANTAAQDAEKVANNPTYIGTDHYVYVYNKETDSFDKTGIYCKGEPGSSFRVAGEYATLEALKSAVPDGSAVDGFMAVGTEAPYDYYAWVNGDWANQGKIAGGGSGNVVVIPAATTNLSDQSTSEEIFEVFGGKQSLIDIIKEIKSTEDCIVVASDNDINSASKIVFSSVSVVYTDDNNMTLSLIAWTVNITAQMVIQIVNGVASCLLNTTPLMTEAPSDGNVYGRKNKDWVKVPENSNVIILPKEILDLTGSSSSEEILAAFGGIDKYKDLFEKLSTNNCLVQIGEPSLGSLRHIYTLVEYTVKFASNKQWGALGFNIYNEEQQLRRLHFYLENNGTTARCGEASTFQLVRDTDVLTKDNTTAYTPTQPYHPATKAYADNIGYGRTISITTTLDKFLNTANLSGVDAEQRVIDLFGSLDNFKNVVANILANHVRYYFHFADNPNNNCIELGCVNACRANNNSSHELHFIITYYDENNLYTNRISIVVNNDTAASKVIIASLVNSDNVATLTKKSTEQYAAITNKDANTVYCVTD